MKVATAILAFTVSTGTRQTHELNASVDGDIRIDLGNRLLRFGPRLERHIPLESVRTFTAAEHYEQCPDCDQEFANKAGLEGHRATKHRGKG